MDFIKGVFFGSLLCISIYFLFDKLFDKFFGKLYDNLFEKVESWIIKKTTKRK